jgi:MFS family permease
LCCSRETSNVAAEHMSHVASSAQTASRSITNGALFVLALGAIDFGLEQSMIVPALPHFAQTYDASLIAVGWLATAYLLTAIVAVPLLARLGDLFGKRRMILVSVSGFAVGSLICAVTDSIAVAIIGRGVQGIGAAIAALTYGLIRDTTDTRHMPRMIGVLIGVANIGGGMGFLLSGLLVDAFSPTAIFWFLFGFGVVVFAGVALLVQESPARKAVGLDPAGALLLSVSLVALLLALSKGSAWGWSSAAIVSLFVASAVGLTAFTAVERRVEAPLVDLHLVRRRPFANTNLCIFTFGFSFFSATLILPLIAATSPQSGYGLGLTATRIGLLLASASVATLAAAWVGGRVVDRIGPRLLAATGACFGVGGYCLLAASHPSAVALGLGTATVLVGSGFIPTAILTVVLRNVTSEKSGVATAVTLVFRSVALSIGVTVTFVVISGAGLDGPFPNEAGYMRAFLVAAAGAAFTLLASLFLPGRQSTLRA